MSKVVSMGKEVTEKEDAALTAKMDKGGKPKSLEELRKMAKIKRGLK